MSMFLTSPKDFIRVDCIQYMGLRSAEKSFTYKLGYEKVFKEAKDALSDCEFIVQNVDEESGIIKAYVGASFRSYGEDITITVSKTEKGTHVTAYSRAKAAIFDWGKSGENVNNFFAALDKWLCSKKVKPSFGRFE